MATDDPPDVTVPADVLTGAEQLSLPPGCRCSYARSHADGLWHVISRAQCPLHMATDDLASAVTGTAGKAASIGPFETEQEALDTPAVRAAYGAFVMPASNQAMLLDACSAAEVTLGEYDERILAWLAGYEPQMCAVVAGLIRRAAAGGAR